MNGKWGIKCDRTDPDESEEAPEKLLILENLEDVPDKASKGTWDKKCKNGKWGIKCDRTDPYEPEEASEKLLILENLEDVLDKASKGKKGKKC